MSINPTFLILIKESIVMILSTFHIISFAIVFVHPVPNNSWTFHLRVNPHRGGFPFRIVRDDGSPISVIWVSGSSKQAFILSGFKPRKSKVVKRKSICVLHRSRFFTSLRLNSVFKWPLRQEHSFSKIKSFGLRWGFSPLI